MKYYRVVKGDVYDHFTGYATVKNELVTEKERNKMFRYLFDSVFEPVEISKRKIYKAFGCRFEIGTSYA